MLKPNHKAHMSLSLLAGFALLSCMGVLLCLCAAFALPAQADSIPIAANQHKAVLIRSAHAFWGMDAPVATFAAQVHQESLWRVDAKSPVGAQGIAQFMPSTSAWIATVYPNALRNPQPFNPSWAMRALVIYDLSLYKQNQASSACEQWAMTLSAYNGGQGWVNRDRKLALAKGANGLAWFDHIERFNAGRSSANFSENRHYPRAILSQWEPLYVANNWGIGVCAERYAL